ncbi:MAG: hypothetical protein ACYCRD_06270 [Leptospirillum sp.]
MKDITLSADESLIEAAREKARSEHTSLNEVFRVWLRDYTRHQEQINEAFQVMDDLRGTVKIGRKLTREEMNER